MVNVIDYEGIEFPVNEKKISRIEQKNNIYINVFWLDLSCLCIELKI